MHKGSVDSEDEAQCILLYVFWYQEIGLIIEKQLIVVAFLNLMKNLRYDDMGSKVCVSYM